jgi:hypothetical protein
MQTHGAQSGPPVKSGSNGMLKSSENAQNSAHSNGTFSVSVSAFPVASVAKYSPENILGSAHTAFSPETHLNDA